MSQKMADNYYKTNQDMEQALINEINRYKAINKYTATLLSEQASPEEDPTLGAMPTPSPEAPAPGAELPAPDAEAPAPDSELPAPGGEEAGDSTEEIDITDLVNMTKNIKQHLDDNKTEGNDVNQKMDGVFSKLAELETKLGEMDTVLSKIDELGAKIEQMKPPTPVEKLEMRSLDSYPFSQKPDEFFAEKQNEMRASGKNEYVLRKSDIENYNKEQVMKSFNPENNQ